MRPAPTERVVLAHRRRQSFAFDKTYGLAKPALSATVSYTQADRKPQTLLVGKQRGDKPEFFAKLASEPAVFVIKKEVRDALAQNSLAYRPLQLWDHAPGEVVEVRVQQGGQSRQLRATSRCVTVSGPPDRERIDCPTVRRRDWHRLPGGSGLQGG